MPVDGGDYLHEFGQLPWPGIDFEIGGFKCGLVERLSEAALEIKTVGQTMSIVHGRCPSPILHEFL